MYNYRMQPVAAGTRADQTSQLHRVRLVLQIEVCPDLLGLFEQFHLRADLDEHHHGQLHAGQVEEFRHVRDAEPIDMIAYDGD
ncbi:hypothetical protein ACQEVF_22645 [Nonomuraea polychroma]|uniref:hypothetical protein n=1 Tax=Nonomuraea polychroma TaxID=46176 RepID=UPI003D950700